MRNCSSQHSEAAHDEVATVCIEAHWGGFWLFDRACLLLVSDRSTHALKNMRVLFLQLLKHFGAMLRLL